MARDSLKEIEGTGGAAPRLRVRTPGKHIVLFALAVTFMLALSTTAIRSGRISIEPDLSATDATAAPLFSGSEEYLVDLAPDATGRAAFLKLDLRLIAGDRKALAEIEEMSPQVRERILFFLRELSADDFAGSEASVRLKAELLKRAQLQLSDGAVTGVVIENIVIQ